MNDTAKPIAPLNLFTAPWWDRRVWRLWRYQAQVAVGTMDVVVINEDTKDPLEVVLIQNQEPVEAFRPDGPHKPLRHAVGLGGSKRRANDLDVLTPKHRVETTGKFLIAIANQETNGLLTLRARPGQLPGLLRDPLLARMRGTAGQVHTTAAQLDEEQHVQPLQPDRLHREEVDRKHALSMRPNELAPCHP
jgi:hypothetical protein